MPTYLMCVTYESNVSVFSSKWNDLHAWNNCSLVLPILEYCCLNWFCNPIKSMFIGLNDSYHTLASTNVKQTCCTLRPSWNACVSIQSFILRRCASTSSSGLPVIYVSLITYLKLACEKSHKNDAIRIPLSFWIPDEPPMLYTAVLVVHYFNISSFRVLILYIYSLLYISAHLQDLLIQNLKFLIMIFNDSYLQC